MRIFWSELFSSKKPLAPDLPPPPKKKILSFLVFNLLKCSKTQLICTVSFHVLIKHILFHWANVHFSLACWVSTHTHCFLLCPGHLPTGLFCVLSKAGTVSVSALSKYTQLNFPHMGNAHSFKISCTQRIQPSLSPLSHHHLFPYSILALFSIPTFPFHLLSTFFSLFPSYLLSHLRTHLSFPPYLLIVASFLLFFPLPTLSTVALLQSHNQMIDYSVI
jgi:hypothetical protein